LRHLYRVSFFRGFGKWDENISEQKGKYQDGPNGQRMYPRKGWKLENQQKVPDSHGIWFGVQLYRWRGVITHVILLFVTPLLLMQENVAIFTELSTFVPFSDNTVYPVFPNHLEIINHYIMDCGCFKEKP